MALTSAAHPTSHRSRYRNVSGDAGETGGVLFSGAVLAGTAGNHPMLQRWRQFAANLPTLRLRIIPIVRGEDGEAGTVSMLAEYRRLPAPHAKLNPPEISESVSAQDIKVRCMYNPRHHHCVIDVAMSDGERGNLLHCPAKHLTRPRTSPGQVRNWLAITCMCDCYLPRDVGHGPD